MCWLVIMCALALIKTGTEGVVISGDKTPAVQSGDKRRLGDECFPKCVPRCQQFVKTKELRCCNCDSFCENVCDKTSKNLLQRTLEETKTPCIGDCLPDVLWRRLLVPRALRRTKRRPSRSPMLREAAIIARSVGMDLGPLDTGSEKYESISGSSVEKSQFQITPRLESLVRGEDSVTVQVSWGPLASPGLPSGAPWYLVAWEPEGGGVRGNLLTNSTSASLTLWPDNVYHIQVSSPSARAGSQCLQVDTHPPPPPQLAHGIAQRFALSRVEELGGAAAALLLFLCILIVFAKRWKTRLESSSKNIDHHNQYGDHFKLYPPPVTLRSLAGKSQTTQQLSV